MNDDEQLELQQRSGYYFGFFDAQAGEPLYQDATDDYRAGWGAYWSIREILNIEETP